MTTGEKITALRLRNGLTQDKFCEEFNRRHPELKKIIRSSYSMWENDARNMQLNYFRAIVKYYRVSADDMLFDERIPDILKKKQGSKRAVSV